MDARRAKVLVERYTVGMQIDPERLRELMHLYEEEFNEKLTKAEAEAMATRLVALYEKLYSPTSTESKSEGKEGELTNDLHPS